MNNYHLRHTENRILKLFKVSNNNRDLLLIEYKSLKPFMLLATLNTFKVSFILNNIYINIYRKISEIIK